MNNPSKTNELEEFDNRQLQAAHTFAYQRIRSELANGEVPDELYTQLGKVCFETLKRQDEENKELGI